MARGGASPRDKHVRTTRAGHASAVHIHGPDSDEAQTTKRALEAAKYAARIDEIVAGWPELSDEKLNRIAGLLRVGARGQTPK